MNRRELLKTSLQEEKNVAAVVVNILKKDLKVLAKAKRDLEDSLEEVEEKLEERLSSNTPLDKSVVEVLFSKINDLKSTIALYESFEKIYFPKSE